MVPGSSPGGGISTLRIRVFLRALSALFVAVVLLAASVREEIVSRIGNFLVASDPLGPADAIVILNGELHARPQFAARLFHQGLAPRIIVARMREATSNASPRAPNMTDLCVAALEALHVPASRIVELQPVPGVAHTSDEAAAALAYCRTKNFSRLIVVTTDMHSKRARFIFREKFRQTPVRILVAAAPGWSFNASNWWRTKLGVIGCRDEYIKLLYYRLRY
jgi:uncharacterized SAM-binding protein YcdF (DUF218 family)